MKRFLSLLLVLVMVLSMVPAVSFAAEVRTVYWDPVSGADANNGLTEAAPVQTVEAAYAALSGADEGVIVMLSTLTLTSTEATVFPESAIPVTITSKTGAEGFHVTKHIFFSGDTTLENMTLTLNADNNTTYLSSEGHDLTVGEGITCAATYSDRRFCLTTKYGEGSNGDATLTVKSGLWRNIFYGGYNKATTGHATLIMTGGEASNLVGPTFSGNYTGDASAYVTGGKIYCLMAGPNETGSLTGDVDIHLGGGVTITKVRMKRVINSKVIPINGTLTVSIEGDCTNIGKICHESATGHIDKTVLVLKSGILDIQPDEVDEVRVEIPEGKTMKLVGTTIAADTVDSAGTLIFSGASALSAQSITGSLDCQISGEVKSNYAYVTAPAGSNITFPVETGVKEANGSWLYAAGFDTENFKGLVLRTTVDGISVKLYKGFSTNSANLLTPVYVDGNDYYYEVTAGSKYYLISKPESGYDRYNLHKHFYITEEEAKVKTVVDVTPAQRSTEGWDPSGEIRHRTEEVMSKVYPSDASLWPQYAAAFTTPAFGEGRNQHMQTTQTEMMDFINGLDDDNDNMYVYNLGQSGGKAFDIPLVIFTTVDLSGATTLEAAAALIRADGEKNSKLTIHYQAQIHGNEPAAGEAALGMLKRLDGDYGMGLLDTMNIYVIPRLSPYGAYKSQRVVDVNGASADPNRDFLRLRTKEAQARMVAYNLFEPEVVLDGHEYQESMGSASHLRKDLMLCTHWMPAYSEAYKQTALDMAYAAFDQLTADGLYYSWYSNSVGGMGANTGSSNTAFRASLHILMETSGINQGLLNYERRVATHHSAMTGIFAYLDANAAQVRAVVHAQQQENVENGKTYRENDIVILDASTSDHKELNIQGKRVDLATGALTDEAYPANVPDIINRFRIAPTAYVIPAGESFTPTVLALMDRQGISYSFIPAGSGVMLQQYIGTVTEADLTEEKLVFFPEGAYVFTMNQPDGYILANLMEPDVNLTAADKGTLVQQGVITDNNGVFPIYRYIRDLNGNDDIDYIVKELTPKQATVYLDSANGLDTNDGLTEATAVKTLEQAYYVINEALSDGGEGSSAKLVVIGLYDLGAQQVHLPYAKFPVTITGKTTADGFSFTGGSTTDQALRTLELHGDTTFENMTLHVNNSYTYNFIMGNGYKLVLGKGLNTTTKKANCYFSVSGGGYDYEALADSVDVTILSGTWQSIFLGGYRGCVSGTASLQMENATVCADVFAAYIGNVDKVEMDISNTTVKGSIYAGTSTANSPKQIGFVHNGTTITLGENVTATNLYCSAKSYGGITGGVTIITDGADLTKVPVTARYSKLDQKYSTDWVVLKLGREMAANVTVDPAIILDLNGHDVTGKLTVDGTLYVKDSQTDDFTVADGVYGQIAGGISGKVEAAEGYVTLDGRSFHRLEQWISGVAIRPGIAGLYYTGTWQMDEVLCSKVKYFGVAVSLTAMPDEGFMQEGSGVLWTKFMPSELKTGQPITSAMIANILVASAEDNDQRGKAKIYAAPYIVFDDGKQDGRLQVSKTQPAYSLYDVLCMVEEVAYDANQAALEGFYATWKEAMQDWEFTKIGK